MIKYIHDNQSSMKYTIRREISSNLINGYWQSIQAARKLEDIEGSTHCPPVGTNIRHPRLSINLHTVIFVSMLLVGKQEHCQCTTSIGMWPTPHHNIAMELYTSVKNVVRCANSRRTVRFLRTTETGFGGCSDIAEA